LIDQELAGSIVCEGSFLGLSIYWLDYVLGNRN
jgi:hypothetical protein